jgi:hypothetical protein
MLFGTPCETGEYHIIASGSAPGTSGVAYSQTAYIVC